MDKVLTVEMEAIEAVDEAIVSLLREGLDVVRDPAIAAGFVEAVTTRLSGPGSKRPFSVILDAAVHQVVEQYSNLETQGVRNG